MKKILLLILSIFSFTSFYGKPISPNEALEIFQNSNNKVKRLASQNQFFFKKEIQLKNGEPTLYIFDKKDSNGFIILSADDNLINLVGYTDQGSYSDSALPLSFQGWMDEYLNQLEYLKENNLINIQSQKILPNNPGWEAIQPLVKTKWDQGIPYNLKCPEINGNKCVTGCVATAMAQVINYFQYPAKGTGFISYIPNHNFPDVLYLDLEKENYDYKNMLDEYENEKYTEIEAEAVSTLMKSCGYTVNMNYGIWESSAYINKVKSALVNNFKYDTNIKILQRIDYSYDEWIQMIYSNLQKTGPVIYSGDSGYYPGHCFVCDGYDGNGYFHINWGWGGYCDGYFILDYLNPYGIGTGGGNGAYNAHQYAIFNIQPYDENNTEEPTVILEFNLQGSIKNNKLHLTSLTNKTLSQDMITGYYYGNDKPELILGFIIKELDTNSSEIYYQLDNKPLVYDDYWVYMKDIDIQEIPISENIKYKFSLAYLYKDNWIPLQTANRFNNYFYLLKKETEYSVENVEIAELTLKKFEISPDLYKDRIIQYQGTVENNSDRQLSQSVGFEIRDSNGKRIFFSNQYSILTLNPGEYREVHYETGLGSLTSNNEEEMTFPMPLFLVPFDYLIKQEYEYPPIPVTIHKQSPLIEAFFSMPEYISKDETYLIEKKNNIYYELNIEVDEGIFNEPVKITLLSNEFNLLYEEVIDFPSISQGNNHIHKGNLNYHNFEKNNTYYLKATWDYFEIGNIEFKVVELPESLELSTHEIHLNIGETQSLSYEVIPSDAYYTSNWFSDNPDIAIIEDGIVKAKGIGNCHIILETSNGLKDTCKIIVEPIYVKDIIIKGNSNVLEKDRSYQFIAEIYPENASYKNVKWESGDTKIFLVDQTGKITTVGTGKTFLRVSALDGSNISQEIEIDVIQKALYIQLNYTHCDLLTGETLQLIATVLPEDATDKNIKWETSNNEIVSISQEGKLTAVSEGKAIITASCGEISTTCEIYVSNPVIEAESIILNIDKYELYINDILQLEAIVFPENTTNKTIIWQSSNNDVAIVNDSGLITAISKGFSIVTATSGNVTASCKITVLTPIIEAEQIDLNIESAELNIGETIQLEATVLPEDTTEKSLSWNSSNPNVAMVSDNGLISAIKVGSAIITVTCGGVSAECKITVLEDAGVENLLANPDSRISIYTPDGILIKKDCKVEDLKNLNKGTYIICIGKDRYKISI